MDKNKIEQIEKLYNEGKTTNEIGRLIGYKSSTTTKRILLELGYDLKSRIGSNSRQLKLNENYFNNIDTPNKAYILGWIISDGYVNTNKLIFNIKDLEILELIKTELESEHKISKTSSFDKRTNKTYEGYSLQICSKKLIKSLNKLGIYQAKSFTVELPRIDETLYPHLIRGIFDGDGHIGIGKQKSGKLIPRFSMIVSEIIYNDLEPIFNELGIIYKSPELISSKNGDNILKIRIYKKEELLKFFNYIYPNYEVSKLNRKYTKMLMLFN